MSARTVELNPLRLGGKALPPQLVLIARFLALTLVLLGPSPFSRHLPYLEALDSLGTAGQFDGVLEVAMRAGIALVLFGPFTRTGCLLVGAPMLLGLLACRPCQSVAHTYVACVFVILALSSHASGPWLLRMQLVVVYAGATLNKVLDPDWWNGSYIETLMITRHDHGPYADAAALLPPLALSTLVGIVTILTEAAMVACFLRRRWYGTGIALGVCFHSVMVLLMGLTFGPFYAATMITFVAFLDWPQRIEIAAGRGAWARWLRRALAVGDPDGTWTVTGRSAPAGAGRVVVTTGEREYRGLPAVPRMLLAAPPVLACFAVALVDPVPAFRLRNAAIVCALVACLAASVTGRAPRTDEGRPVPVPR